MRKEGYRGALKATMPQRVNRDMDLTVGERSDERRAIYLRGGRHCSGCADCPARAWTSSFSHSMRCEGWPVFVWQSRLCLRRAGGGET
jgi:hypothetical protein